MKYVGSATKNITKMNKTVNEKKHFRCWLCNYEGKENQFLHISESYLRVNNIGQLVLVCKEDSKKLVDPMVIRKFRKLFEDRD